MERKEVDEHCSLCHVRLQWDVFRRGTCLCSEKNGDLVVWKMIWKHTCATCKVDFDCQGSTGTQHYAACICPYQVRSRHFSDYFSMRYWCTAECMIEQPRVAFQKPNRDETYNLNSGSEEEEEPIWWSVMK